MKRIVLQLMRTVVTLVVMCTMAAMIFSLRNQLSAAKAALKASEEGVYVLCRFDLKANADIADYVSKTRSVIPEVLAEKGCRMYTLLKDADTDWELPMRFGERTFWMVEKWDSIEALKAHLKAPHMKSFGPTVRDMRTSSTFHVLEPAR